jgi:hypothetical protein
MGCAQFLTPTGVCESLPYQNPARHRTTVERSADVQNATPPRRSIGLHATLSASPPEPSSISTDNTKYDWFSQAAILGEYADFEIDYRGGGMVEDELEARTCCLREEIAEQIFVVFQPSQRFAIEGLPTWVRLQCEPARLSYGTASRPAPSPGRMLVQVDMPRDYCVQPVIAF